MPVATAAQLRGDLIPYLSGTGEDALLLTFIDRADAAIAQRLGFPTTSGGALTLASSSYTAYPDAENGGRVDGSTLRLTPWPVSAITTIHDDQRGGNVAYDSGSLVSSADYELDGPAGRVYLVPVRVFGAFSSYRRRCRVVFVAGWATLPADLMQAVLILAKHMYERRAQQGLVSADGKTLAQAEPPEIAELIGRYSVKGYL
jgi:uncharacterized phiE125 gp8 family phage protein